MKKQKHIISTSVLLFCSLCCSFFSFSQVYYPSDSSFISTLSHAEKNNFQSFTYSKVDTSITNFQNYYPRNTNGNIGLPSAPLFLKYESNKLGFNLYQSPYKNDIINEDALKYYQTKGPYASLTGIAGSKQEQVFNLLFSNTFKNKLNITLAFNRYSALGFYKKQQTFTNNFYVSSNYTSKNNRVGYYTFFLFNRLKHLENGGIKNDTLFLENTFINKQLLPTHLSNAKRDVRYTYVSFNPWVKLNKSDDSISVISHVIDYQLDYSGNYTKYTDPSISFDNYYAATYLDTITTKDSTHWRKVANALNYTLKINPINMKLTIGFKNEYNSVYQYRDSSFINNSVNAGLFLFDKNYTGFLKANYIFKGTNATDYSIEISNRYTKKIFYDVLKIPFIFSVKAQFERRHPDFIYNTWFSNHFMWGNVFLPTEKQQVLISMSTPDNRFDIGVLSQTIKHQLYFNEFATSQQANVSIQNVSFFIHKDVLLFKHLGINTQYTYQMSSYQAIVSLPNHIANGALYYEGNLFKKALQLQIGFNAQYFSEFNSYAYMPATNVYYVQTKKLVGDYPYVDFFINARIKPVRIFVKIDQLTQGFSGKNYSLAAGYLQNDRAFKFGINWLFFD